MKLWLALCLAFMLIVSHVEPARAWSMIQVQVADGHGPGRQRPGPGGGQCDPHGPLDGESDRSGPRADPDG